MNISSLTTPTNQTNFRAIKIAEVRNFAYKTENQIDIYKLEHSDLNFLMNWADKVKIKDLFPKIKTFLQERWQRIFDYCVDGAMFGDNIGYIAVKDNKPCGIMTYLKQSPLYLDGICSVPTDINQKEAFVGKTLFYQLFKDATELNSRAIELKAVEDGPINVIDKYKELGFICEGKEDEYTKMSCNRGKFPKTLKQLSELIDYSEVKNEHVNLEQFLD